MKQLRKKYSIMLMEIFFHIKDVFQRFFRRLLFGCQTAISGRDEREYWKNKIFLFVSGTFLTLGPVLLLIGAYLFYRSGRPIQAAANIVSFFINAFIITRTKFNIAFRKMFLVLSAYLFSVSILITAGITGGGMLFVCLSLILAGLLLEKRHVKAVVAVNLGIFVILSVLLMTTGLFDSFVLAREKSFWFINVTTVQIGSIFLLVLMNTVFTGLERQARLIKSSRSSLKASEIKHKTMLENISDVILIVDETGHVKYNSPNLRQRYQWLPEDIRNKRFDEVFYLEDKDLFLSMLQRLAVADGTKQTTELKYLRGNKTFGYIELTGVSLKNDTHIKGILMNFHDITQRRIKEDKILKLSYHDGLTGLFNRTYFEMKKRKLDCEEELPLSVITGDINGLKIINDAMGHCEGDQLLTTIAKILIEVLPPKNIISRTGGDEFNILMPKTGSAEAMDMIDRINEACDDYNRQMCNELYDISISLGTATKTTMEESIELVLKIAEDNMYKRKLLESRSVHSAIISSMKTVLFEKSQETEGHARRLAELTKAMGQEIGLNKQQFDELELFSTLHDIGKVGIDNNILNKPGKLTDEEWSVMKKHSEIGYRIAMASTELMPIADDILTHHERWDGKGYPQGLSGMNIPLLSRILAVADAYDAMVSDRPYRKAMTKQAAIDEICRNAGTQFDPDISGIFVGIVGNEEGTLTDI